MTTDTNKTTENRLKEVSEQGFHLCYPTRVGDTFYVAGSYSKKITDKFATKRGVRGKGKKIAVCYEEWAAVVVSVEKTKK